tara:strand:- start:880 stop:2403 length:1524 start_codon:yes stop_codon:yes gene_type:complete
MSLTKVTYSMIKGMVGNSQDFANLVDAFAVYSCVDVTADITLTANLTIPGNGKLFSSNNSKITTAGFGINQTNNDVTIEGLRFNCTGNGGALTVIQLSCNGALVTNNQFFENTGGVSYDIVIGGLRNSVIANDFTGTPSQGLVGVSGAANFIITENNFHDSGLTNNCFTRSSQFGVISNNTFTNTPNNPIFIDTGSSSIQIIGNTLNETGDSGILLGNDLAGAVPDNITITGNVVFYSPDTGIGGTGTNVVVANNIIRDCGRSNVSGPYASGILCGGPDSWSITGNVISNLFGQANTRYGIYLTSPTPIDVSDHIPYLVEGNVFTNIVTQNIFSDLSGGNRQENICVNQGAVMNYPIALSLNAWSGALPTNVAGLSSFVLAGAGITISEETSIVISGSSAKVVATTNAGGLDISLLAFGQMQKQCMLEVTGYAYAAGGTSGTVALAVNSSSGGAHTYTTSFTGAVWSPVTLRTLIDTATSVAIKCYADTGGTVYFDEFQVKITHFNN